MKHFQFLMALHIFASWRRLCHSILIQRFICLLITGSIALVMTDYPDPLYQSEELKQISGEYEFEFMHLITPYANDQHIEIRPNDDIDNNFFISDPKSYYRYYLAAVRQNSR